MTHGLLLSGGMDSSAIAWWKRPANAITIDYGQRAASAEVKAANQICKEIGISHHVLRIDCGKLGTGDMANAAQMSVAPTPEWWPFRNQMLITFAAAYLMRFGVKKILIGTLITDSINKDGTERFVETLDTLLALQEGAIRLVAPAIEYDATSLVRISNIPLSVLSWSHSCHIANHACGACRGCSKRAETWEQLNRL